MKNEETYHLLGVTETGPFSGIRFISKLNKDQGHELWNLKRIFDIKGGSNNEADWKTKTVPDDLIFEEKEGKMLLAVNCSRYGRNEEEWPFGNLHKMLNFKHQLDDEGVAVQWSSNFFAILVEGEENKGWLTELHKAILNKDIVLYMIGRGYSSDLELQIYSRTKVKRGEK